MVRLMRIDYMKRAEISVDKVSKDFVQGQSLIHILKEVSISFEQGKTYAICGASGTGKSTFMHILASLDSPTSGLISFNGTSLRSFSQEALEYYLNRSIGLVFQLPYLIREI